MCYEIISLTNLLKTEGEEKAKNILQKFKSIPSKEKNDVECFLHEKAISFEKASISTTHLVYKSFENKNYLVGYFSLANKKLMISEKNFKRLSAKLKRKFAFCGRKTETGDFYVNSYLIGQLGKNFSKDIPISVPGNDLLSIAYDMLCSANLIVRASYVWVECKDNENILNFYKHFGFTEISNFTSSNNLKVLIMKLE